MPKERTHFRAISAVIDRLEGTPLSASLRKNRHLAFLGSITHDLFYYHPNPHLGDPTFASVADRLHGTEGEDTFLPLANLTTRARQNSNCEKRTAFLVGLLSHVYLDAEFHPYVYFATGNIYDSDPGARTAAIRRHRRLEVMLDLLMCDEPSRHTAFDIHSTVSSEAAFLKPIYRALFGFPRAKTDVDISNAAFVAANRQSKLNRMFSNRLLGSVAGVLFGVSPAKTREVLALFYWSGLKRHLRQFKGTLRYRNPATGEECRKTLGAMLENAVSKTAEKCKRSFSKRGTDICFESPSPGPSLELGLAGLQVDRMRYFSSTPPTGT